ncbi:MAG: ABC transporter ATP-binding protein [Deltaproteobacteria bacterium]|nr:ABC transporter ATP-binding protein [Deltaproteobacteria bacterium]
MGSSHPEGKNAESEYDVVLKKISHYFGSLQVLKDVSLAVIRGEFFGILGPSGSGKTTVLRIIGGFTIPSSGQVYLQNELMGRRPPYRRNVTTVFQNLALFPHMTVYDNLAYGLTRHKFSKNVIQEKVFQALDMVRLKGLENRYPKKLSGGQQQRVALARALILEPAVVLFDEPLGALDLKLRREMQIELKQIQRRLGITFIYVTHDQQEALNMCDRIAVMNDRVIEQIGTTVQIYEQPGSRFVADFIGDTNFLEGRVLNSAPPRATVDCEGVTCIVEAGSDLQPGEMVALSIRPERILIAPGKKVGPNVYKARVADNIYAGASRRCILELPGNIRINADVDARTASSLTVDRRVTVGWSPEDAYVITR